MTNKPVGRLPLPSILLRPGPWFVVWILWLASLAYLSSRTLPELPGPELIGIDKLVHAVFFFIGQGILGLVLRLARPGWPSRVHSIILVMVGALVGGLDEWHQSFTPGRQGLDLGDWIADIVGSVAAAAVLALFFRPRPSGLPGLSR